MSNLLHPLDLALIALYLVAIVWKGVRVGRLHRTADDFFLAGRDVAWPLVGVSLFASNISSTTLVGLAGDAYATGISVFDYEWMSAVVLVFAGAVFLPRLLAARTTTLPEFLGRRFGPAARRYFTGLTLFLNIVVDTAGSLYAGALMLRLLFPALSMTEIVVGLTIASGLYTSVGGLTAVIQTDAIQAVLLLIGSVFIAGAAYLKVGGWSELVAAVDPEMLSLVRPVGDPGVPWPGLLTGVPLLGFYFWCTNQFMAQRFLAARDLTHARRGALFAGFLKLPVLFLMVLPGTAAIVLYPGLSSPDLVYPTLLTELLPTGLLGLVIAGFLAALMSQIDSTLNSAATLITMDVLRPRRPDWSPAQVLRAGRLATLGFMALAALWAPQIGRFGSLFKYLQAVLSYTVPPVLALYLAGLFWPRATARGAIWCLAGGLALGAALFISNRVLGWTSLHFLYVAPLLTVVSTGLLVAGSLSGPRSDAATEAIWSRPDGILDAGRPWYARFAWQSAALLAATTALVYAFA